MPNQARAGRVVLAIDTASLTLPALEAAVALASAERCPLLTLFIADPALLGHGALPVSLPLGRSSDADPMMGAAFGLQADYLRQAAGALASSFAVNAVFEVARGASMTTALARLLPGDALVVQQGPPSRFVIGARGSFHTLEGRPVTALLDESPAAERVLHTAVALAHRVGTEVLVLLPATTSASFDARRRAVVESIARQIAPDLAGTPVRYERIDAPEATELARHTSAAGACAFVWSMPARADAVLPLTQLKGFLACPLISLS